MIPKAEEASSFLEALFPEVPDQAAILVWHLKGRRSTWATTIEEATTCALESGGDVYVGACLGPMGKASSKRARADEVLWMPGLWLDVDILDPAHQKKNLPKSEAEALGLIAKMPILPSIVLHSGHGLQAWWLFHELLDLSSDRDLATKLASGWNSLIRKHADGMDVDSVHDLARVMRIAGTQNCKGNDKIDVKLIKLNDKVRYSTDDFMEWIPENESIVTVAAQSGLIISAGAQPPFDKFEAALINCDNFKKSWNHKRKDLVDQSPSGYDLSIATQAVTIGWTDQEIVDVLIAFRRKHGLPQKLRRDYYTNTLKKAHTVLEQSDADERLERLANGDTISIDLAIKTLSESLGIQIISIEKTASDEPVFFMKTATGDVSLGTIAGIFSQSTFRQRVSLATGVVIPRKKKGWDDIVQVILNACTVIEIGDTCTYAGEARDWIASYVNDFTPHVWEADPVDDLPQTPILKRINNSLTLTIEPRHFRHWLRTAPGYGDRLEHLRIGIALSRVGGKTGTVRYGNKTQRRWQFLYPQVLTA